MFKNFVFVLLSFFLTTRAFSASEPLVKTEYDSHTLVTTSGLVTWFITTIAILILIVVIGLFLKRSRFVKRQSGQMAIEGQLALGPKERAVIIKVGNRKILLGVTAHNINYLADLGEDNPFINLNEEK